MAKVRDLQPMMMLDLTLPRRCHHLWRRTQPWKKTSFYIIVGGEELQQLICEGGELKISFAGSRRAHMIMQPTVGWQIQRRSLTASSSDVLLEESGYSGGGCGDREGVVKYLSKGEGVNKMRSFSAALSLLSLSAFFFLLAPSPPSPTI